MPHQSSTPLGDQSSGVIRLDPSPSKVFTFLEWRKDAPAVIDDNGRTLRPAEPTLTVHYRYNGAVWEFWPVSEEEANKVMNPGSAYGYSIGSAFSQIIKAHKSGRLVKPGERQKQEEKPQQRRRLA